MYSSKIAVPSGGGGKQKVEQYNTIVHSSCRVREACGIFPWNVESIDFSKCLGKRFEGEQINFNQPPKYDLKYDQFTRIIGL
jgi:hypothetical protein